MDQRTRFVSSGRGAVVGRRLTQPGATVRGLQRVGRFAFACSLALLVGGCGFGRVLADLKIYWMCKQDGGIHVLEKEVPPPEVLRPNGTIHIGELQLVRPGQPYLVRSQSKTIQIGQPTILRIEDRLYRNKDNKLLGTAVTYLRPVDDLGPFSPFSRNYVCPDGGALRMLVKAIFGVETE